MNPHVLLGGTNNRDLGYGVIAQDIFEPLDYYASTANPPWAWNGGPGDGKYFLHNGGYWYSFAEDGTGNAHYSPGPWNLIANGTLLMNGGAAAGRYFYWPGGFTEPQIFNAYHTVVTYPPPSQPLAVNMTGPDVVNAGDANTWIASVSGGFAPYTYQWSGPLAGSGQSVSGQLNNDSVLYLDVWDASGVHLAVSKAVSVSGCNGQITC